MLVRPDYRILAEREYSGATAVFGRFSSRVNFRAKRHFTFVSELSTATIWNKLLHAKNIASGKPALDFSG